MEKEEIKLRFNAIADKFKSGDPPKLAEITGKSRVICFQIIKGQRKPQQWFIEAAEDYLKVLGRI